MSDSRSISIQLRADVAGYVREMLRSEAAVRALARASEQAARDMARDAAATQRAQERAAAAAARAAERAARDAERAAERHRAAQQKIGQGMLLTGGVIAAGVVIAVKAFADFDKQMSAVAAVSYDASKSDAVNAASKAALGKAAIKAGAETVFSAMDAAKAEGELAKAGVATSDILGGALKGSLDLASAGGLDLASSATIAAQTMNIFGLKGKDVAHIADVLAAGANKSAADIAGLGLSLQQGGLVAAQTGLHLEDTVGILAMFADKALISSDAGTSMKTMLMRLVPQSKQAQAAMDSIGFSAYDAKGKFVGMESVAGQLKQGLGGLSDQTRSATLNTIFGSDASRAATILMTAGAQGVRDYTKAVNDQGAAGRMAGIMLNNLSGDFEGLKGSIDTALIQSGSAGNGVLRTLVQTATGAVNAFGEMPVPLQQGALGLGAVAAAGLLAGGALITLVPKIREAKALMIEFNVVSRLTTAATGPWGVAFIAATAVVGLFVKGQMDAKAKADDLRGSLDQQTGAITDQTRALIAKQLQEDGSLALAKSIGITGQQVTALYMGDAKVIADLTAKRDAANKVMDVTVTKTADLTAATTLGVGATSSWGQAVGLAGSKTESVNRRTAYGLDSLLKAAAPAAKVLGAQTVAQKEVADAAAKTETATKSLKDGTAGLTDKQRALKVAADAAKISLEKETKALQDAASQAFATDTNVLGGFDPAKGVSAVKAAQDALDKVRKDGRDKTKKAGQAEGALQDAQAALDKAKRDQSAASLSSSYATQIAAGQKFVVDIGKVSAKGLDPNVVAKLLKEGPTKAAPALQALLGGNSKTMIKMVNDSETALSAINGRVLEQARLTAMAVGSTTSQMTTDFSKAMAINNALATSGGKATVQSLAKQLKIGAADVRRISDEFGLGIAEGVKKGVTPAKAQLTGLQTKADMFHQTKVPKFDANPTPAKTSIASAQTKLDLFHQVKAPKIDVDKAPAVHTLIGAQADIWALKQGTPPTIDVNTDPGKRKLAQLQQQALNMSPGTLTVTVDALFKAGSTAQPGVLYPLVLKRAGGGLLNGPGTGTSDSIMGIDRSSGRHVADVSTGEFVTNAKATARNLPLLTAINSGAQGFASGGSVGVLPPSTRTRVDQGMDAFSQHFKVDGGAAYGPITAGGGGTGGTGGAAQWTSTVLQVLAMLGQSPANLASVLRLIMKESGGQQFAINRTDSNAAAGHPSQGLIQVIPGTFAAYRSSSLPNLMTDPAANIYAGLNYALSRYGSIAAVDPLRHSGGYAAGTDNAAQGWAMVGERGPEMRWFNGGEKVIPNHKLAKGGLVQNYATGGFVAADFGGITSRIPTSAPSGEDLAAARLRQAKATTALHAAEAALHKLRTTRGHTAAQVSLDEQRLTNARGSLRAATSALHVVEAARTASTKPYAVQFNSAARFSNAGVQRFLINIDKLNRRGFHALADQLVTAGDEGAHQLAASAVASTATARTLTGSLATSARLATGLAARQAAVGARSAPAQPKWALPRGVAAATYGARPAPGRLQSIVVKIGDRELTQIISATVDGHTQQLVNGLVYGGN